MDTAGAFCSAIQRLGGERAFLSCELRATAGDRRGGRGLFSGAWGGLQRPRALGRQAENGQEAVSPVCGTGQGRADPHGAPAASALGHICEEEKAGELQ